MNLFPKFKRLTLALMVIASFEDLSLYPQNKPKIDYPTLKVTPAADNYFGQTITDKYRIMENTKDTSVQEWLSAEKVLSDSILQRISFHSELKGQLEEILYSSNIQGGFPRTAGKKIFLSRAYLKEKIQKIFYKENFDSKEVEIFNTESMNTESKHYHLDYFEPSFDGAYLALGISSNGDEMSVMRIIDMKTKKFLSDSIERVNYGTPFWIPGKNAFFYSQLRKIDTEVQKTSITEDSKIKLHWVNTDPKTDREVLSRNAAKEINFQKADFPIIYTFPGSDKVIGLIFHGTDPYVSLYISSIKELTDQSNNPAAWKSICTTEEKVKSFVLCNNELFVISYKKNSNGILKKYDVNKGSSDGVDIMEGKDEILDDMMQTNNSIYIQKIKNGISDIVRIDIATGKINKVKLPFSGNVTIKAPFPIPPIHLNSEGFFFSIEAWNKEATICYYNPISNQTIETDFHPTSKYGNPKNLIVKEIEIPSYDGTMVPLSIIYSNSIKLDGNNPALLIGYGAYGYSFNSVFNLASLVWLKNGGVYAIAHVRGGGEKGEAWYKGGVKSTKPNSWKDFIACGEYLIKNKYTTSEKLGAKGVSAGGITVGRAITEKPEIFKAA
ncbi:MAG TPA: prolyl oligopeptidase family serine peptidase, partial [Chitinophagales bacterium]|nr:prolyl oligopeptidase family serine peptidase [Chitinophagales bacterium]